ncbi:hypothetical protein JAAARDRAFT_38133 [Jaapia argillacea MUCL 33604]|uniref:Transcription initiation factor IIE subunit beta n=1 Tax=Jaapia argillacea MUCL 33604 TaxID=933084 RepID=A0A067PVV5_9AGAM|nr:hypothetical protein JAAARDRAFT_38133 [Jaapia argillacea MUCL 33604]
MSGLARDAAAFKSALHRQDYSSWHANPAPLETQPAPEVKAKKKRPKTTVVYSQPADTGTGTNVNTQLVYAVNHLKSQNGPMRLQDIAIITNTPLDTDRVLLEKFRAHDRIEYNPKNDTYTYRHDFTFNNKAALLTEIQKHTKHGGGLSVRSLKESWKEAPQVIEELEKEGEVFVTRTVKDGQLRMVFFNDIKSQEEGEGKPVEQEFRDLWHSLKVPEEPDLIRSLAIDGLQATLAEAPAPKPTNAKKKGKKTGSRQRPIRLTNTHLKGEIDLSRDYLPPGK